MRTAAEYRRLAKNAMSGKYADLVGANLVGGLIISGIFMAFLAFLFAAVFALNFMTDAGAETLVLVLLVLAMTVVLVGMALLSMVLNGGIVRLIRCACRGEGTKLGELFYGFQSGLAGRLIGISILTGLIALPFALPYWVWNIAESLLWITSVQSIGAVVFLKLISFLLLVWYMAGFIGIGLYFGLSFYILVDRPQLGAVECMKESLRLTKGRRKELFFLWLSYAGYYILGLMSAGIGFLWIMPNIQCALYYFYWDLRAEKG